MDILTLLHFLMYATAIFSLACAIVLWITADKIGARQLLSITLLMASLFLWWAVFRDKTEIPMYGIILRVRLTLCGAFMGMFFTLPPVESIRPLLPATLWKSACG